MQRLFFVEANSQACSMDSDCSDRSGRESVKSIQQSITVKQTSELTNETLDSEKESEALLLLNRDEREQLKSTSRIIYRRELWFDTSSHSQRAN